MRVRRRQSAWREGSSGRPPVSKLRACGDSRWGGHGHGARACVLQGARRPASALSRPGRGAKQGQPSVERAAPTCRAGAPSPPCDRPGRRIPLPSLLQTPSPSALQAATCPRHQEPKAGAVRPGRRLSDIPFGRRARGKAESCQRGQGKVIQSKNQSVKVTFAMNYVLEASSAFANSL